MKLQNLTIIFIIIVLPVILLTTFYISTGLKTLRYQALYDTGLITATQDAIQAFELNSLNNKYSDNPETKRSIIKSSVKMLETSLCNTCNISSYNTDEIEEYLPAVMFGLSDGFYVYAPSYNPKTQKYEHSLKNYVYYSEMLDDNGIVIRYYLDSYVQISGYFKKNMTSTEKEYCSKEGYLINIAQTGIEGGLISPSKITYYGTEIDMSDQLAVNYFVDNYEFSEWFKSALDGIAPDYLEIDKDNDPEDPESAFSIHKKELIKSKIEGVLNSTITAYSERTYGQEYKMPKLSEEDWEKIYTDVSVTTFFQGKKIGLTKYNGYCVLNSNNHYETINPNLLYFSTDGDATDSSDDDNKINTTSDYYHDIRCSEIKNMSNITIDIGDKKITTLRGFRIGRFQKIKKQDDAKEYDSTLTEVTTEKTYNKYSKYMYERAELACYSCINGTVGNTSVYDYIAVANSDSHTGNTRNPFIKSSYWTSLARERAKLHNKENKESNISVDKKVNGAETATIINGETVTYTITITNNALTTDYIRKIEDIFDENIKIIKDSIQYEKGGSRVTVDDGVYSKLMYSGVKWEWSTELGEGWSIAPGEKIVIKYKAKVYGSVGNTVGNTVKVLPGYSGIPLEDKAQCYIRKSGITVEKLVEPAKIEYGGKVKYTIKIKNEGEYTETINIVDDWVNNKIQPYFDTISFKGYEYNTGNKYMSWSNVTIDPYTDLEITFEATVTGDIGEVVTNWVYVYVPTTNETKIAEAHISSTITKKIKTDSKSSDFKVILVLDASTSMEERTGEIKSAAQKIIDTVGSDNVKLVRFAQSATTISSLDDYVLVADGISTNYVAGLYQAKEIAKAIKNEDNNTNIYVVFMSDGGPTNTQGINVEWGSSFIETWESMKWYERIKALGKMLTDGIINTISAVLGGWMECDWTGGIRNSGNETYEVRLLGTTEIVGAIMEIFGKEDVNAAIKDNVVSKIAWKNKILPALDELNGYVKHISTFYYNTGGGNNPYFGIQQMATTINDAYTASTASDALKEFQNIADKIATLQGGEEFEADESGNITIKYYTEITKIKIGKTEYTGTNLENIKNQIIPVSGTSNGTLNLNNIKLGENYIFKTKDDITIYYGT